ncbi:MAG TPA: peroxiredoxin [Burkholderiales bacterium]|nr:peroxiredoxin [Burkholderiales bacterium]
MRGLSNAGASIKFPAAPFMLQPGQTAPVFTLPDADMQTVELSSFIGKKHIVLYFYPRDNTPGCTLEAAEFSDHEGEFGRCNCVILGVSRDDCLTHAEFRDKHGLSIGLLSDPEGEVCRRYGVLQEKETDGVRRESLVRSTFVIDKKGVIRHAAYGVNPRRHAAEIFDVVRKLKS